MDYTKMDALIDSMKDELLADMKRWIAIPSVLGEAAPGAPFGVEGKKMLDLAMDTARGYGFEARAFDGYCGDVSLGSGDETMGILCHLDVVPAGDGWTHDPFGCEIVDGKIYGRGVVDDKGPALAALYAMRAVRDAGIPLKDGVRLILGCDEETGMTDMRHYASINKMPDYGFSPDAEFPVINIEKGGLGILLSKNTDGEDGAEIPVYSLYAGERPNVVPGVATAEVGGCINCISKKISEIAAARDFDLTAEPAGEGRVKITATGVSAHASMPHLGKNAAGMLLIALKDMNAGGGSRETIAALADKLGLEGDGKSIGIAIEDELSGALTCNLGILRYDGNLLTARLDIRYPICADETTMCGQIAMAVSDAKIAVTRVGGHGPHHVPAEHKIVRGLLKVYGDVTGLPAYAFAIGGGTYSRCMPNTVAFGLNFPGDDDPCHMPDEYIEIDKLMLSVKIMAHAIAELAGGQIAD
ncbi:MAG: dipeptidase PepV [Clostridia bacterium]|nr:dipeptidase PepV [Clostridia bacterium]